MNRIFFDMDGVLAKWNTEASIEEVASPGYFLNREVETNIAEAMKELWEKGYDVQILTSVFSDNHSKTEKKQWLKANCPFLDLNKVNFCVYGENKAEAVKATKHDVLVDDFTPNLKSWSGVGIKFLNGINNTKGTWTGFTISKTSSSNVIAATIAAITTI